MTESARDQTVSRARVDALAAQVEEITGEILNLVRESDNAQWQRSTESEQWPIGVVAHHVADVAGFFTRAIAGAANGIAGMPLPSADEIEQNNARHATAFAAVSQASVIDAIETRVPPLTEQIRLLRDDQLEITVGDIGGFVLTIGQAIELGVIAHFREHAASIRRTLAMPSARVPS